MKTKKFKKLMGVVLALSLIIGLMSPVLNLFAGAADADKAAAVESLKTALTNAKRNLPITVTKWDNNVASTGADVTAVDGKVEFTTELNNTAGSATKINTAAGVYYTLAEAAKKYNIKIADIDDIKFIFNQKDGTCNLLLYIFNTSGTYTRRGDYFEGTDFYGVGQKGSAGKLETGTDNEASIKTFYDANTVKNWSDRATDSTWTTMNNERYFNSLYAQTATLKDCTGVTFYDGTLVYNDPAFATAAAAINADDLSSLDAFLNDTFDASFISNEEEYNAAVAAVKTEFADDVIKFNLNKYYNKLYVSAKISNFTLRGDAFNASGSNASNTVISSVTALPDAANAPLFSELGNTAVQYTFNTQTDTAMYNSNGLFADDSYRSATVALEDLADISFWYHADKAVGTFKISVYYDGNSKYVTYTDDSMKVKSGWNKFSLKEYDLEKALDGHDINKSYRFIACVVLDDGEELTLTMGTPAIYSKSKIAQETFSTADDAYKASVKALALGYVDDNGNLSKAVAAYEKANSGYKDLKLAAFKDAAVYVLSGTKTVSYPLNITSYVDENGTQTANVDSKTFGSEMYGGAYASDNTGTLKGSVILSNPDLNVNIGDVQDIVYDFTANNVTKVNVMVYLGNGTSRTIRGTDIDGTYYANIGGSSAKNLTNNVVNTISVKDLYASSWNNRTTHKNFAANAQFKDVLVRLAAFDGGKITIGNAKAIVTYTDADKLLTVLNNATDKDAIITALLSVKANIAANYSDKATLDSIFAAFDAEFGEDAEYKTALNNISYLSRAVANLDAIVKAADNISYVNSSFVPTLAKNGLKEDSSETDLTLEAAETGSLDFTSAYSASIAKSGVISFENGVIKAVSANPVSLDDTTDDLVLYVKSSADVAMRIFPTLGNANPNIFASASGGTVGLAYRNAVTLKAGTWTKISFNDVFGADWKEIAKLDKEGNEVFSAIDTLYFGINGSATLSVTEVKAVTNSLGASLADDFVTLKDAAFAGDYNTFSTLEKKFVDSAKGISAIGEFGNIGGQAYLNAMIDFLGGFGGTYSSKYYVTANYEGLSVRDAVRFATNGKMDTYAADGVTIDALLAEIAK